MLCGAVRACCCAVVILMTSIWQDGCYSCCLPLRWHNFPPQERRCLFVDAVLLLSVASEVVMFPQPLTDGRCMMARKAPNVLKRGNNTFAPARVTFVYQELFYVRTKAKFSCPAGLKPTPVWQKSMVFGCWVLHLKQWVREPPECHLEMCRNVC